MNEVEIKILEIGIFGVSQVDKLLH